MLRRAMNWLGLGAVISSLGCGSDAAPAGPVEVTVDTFNVALAGAFIPFETERRGAVAAAVAAMPSDIVCLQEVWRQEDKDAIATAARARFAHSYSVRHDLASAITQEIDPMCPGGMAPPAEPATPPCADMMVRPTFESGLACLTRNCSTMMSDMGQTTSTACASSRCLMDVVGLLTGGPNGLRCYGCLAPQLPTETFGSIRTACTANPRAGLAFNGQSGTMILSRYPLSETETVVIPGTWNRRVITRATATLPNGARLGVYCNHLSPVFEGPAFPYTGRYGCGQTGRDGWVSEQTAQARALIAYVQRREATGRAIVLGDFNTGPASRAGQPEILEEAPETYAVLSAAFRSGLAANYVPSCTFCPENALVTTMVPVWIDHIFLRGFAEGAVRRTERTFTTATVTAPGRAQPVHVSDHYGLRSVISVAP